MSVNKVLLIGNLGKDPDVKYTQSGQSVCNFSIACNERWTDKQGQRQERVEWVNIVAWGVLADNVGKYLSKGRQCYVEGKLQTRKWKDKNGVDRWTTEVVARDVKFLGSKSDDQRPPVPAQSSTPDYGPPPPADDDIAF